MNAENKETEELQKCSHCGCKKLLKFFSIRESTGKYYKTCINCREKMRLFLFKKKELENKYIG